MRTAEKMVLPSASGPRLPAIGNDLKDYLGAADLHGYARINGDALHELRLDGHVDLNVIDKIVFDGWFLLRDVDSDTPAGKCLEAGGAKTEIGMGASTEFQWGVAQPVELNLGGKVAIGAGGMPVGLAGDFGIGGDFDFSAVRVNDLQLGFGFGANQGYLYGRGAGKIKAMDIAAGVFVGRTCDGAVIRNADPDIGALIDNQAPPITGVAIYAEGGMSLMPLIGVPPSCVLDLRVHGGQGFFGFEQGNQFDVGIKTLQGVSGELLCLVDVRGDFVTVLKTQGTFENGSPTFNSLTGSARGTLRGEIGVGFLSVDFEKSARLIIEGNNDGVDWSFDY